MGSLSSLRQCGLCVFLAKALPQSIPKNIHFENGERYFMHTVCQKARALAALAAILVLAACDLPPESRSALSDGPTVDYDKRMLGGWMLLIDDEPTILKVSKGNQPQTIQAIFTMISRRNVGWGHTTAYATKIGKTVYYNVRRTKGKGQDYTAPGEQPGYLIVRPFFVDRDIMVICTVHSPSLGNSGVAKMAGKYGMRTRKVTGRIEKDKAEYVILDVTQQELRRLIAAAPPEELFGGYLPFVRMGAAASKMADVRKWMKDRRKAKRKGCPFEWSSKGRR